MCATVLKRTKQIKLAMLLTMQIIRVPPQSTVLSSPNFDQFVKRKQAASVAPESHDWNHLLKKRMKRQV